MRRWSIVLLFSLLLAFAMSLVFPCRVFAQASLDADPADPVYHAIDLFIADGLVGDVIMGQRPFTRLEVARILREVRKNLEERKKVEDEVAEEGWKAYSRQLGVRYTMERNLEFYEREYARELAGMLPGVTFEGLKRADLDLILNTSTPRQIPFENGQGMIRGFVTSFDQYDQGITLMDGGNSLLRTEHNLYLTRYLAFQVQPLFLYQTVRQGEDQASVQVHKLYFKGGISNFEVEFGRDTIYWGQGERGGMMLSTNPRPLDMLRISNPYPLHIPYLGHMKWTLFISNLGPDQDLAYPYFYGLKWTWKPWKYFEFGLSETVIMGGDGAPKVSFWEPLTELFPFHKWGANNIGAKDSSDHAFGFLDLRVTIPWLRNSVLYYDGYIEDSIVRAFRLPDNFLNQMGFVAGWYSPRLSAAGDWGLRLEYHHTAPLDYRHGQWSSGYTENGRVMGDALGPDADAAYATVYWLPRPSLQGRLDLAFEDYDSSLYTTETNAAGGGDRIIKIADRTHERRYRALAGIRWDAGKRYGLRLSAGYERIDNWNFEAGRSVNNALLGAGLTLRFDEFTVSSPKSRLPKP